MLSSFELFKQQLDDAVDLIDKTDLVSPGKNTHPPSIDTLVDTQSLLARCESVSKKYKSKKPIIRVIHHLACSGGTLISKCISAMPNVYLLSEVHPYTDLALSKDKPKYAPSDIVSLTKYAGVPKQKELAAKIFKSSIDEVYNHVAKLGGTLVLRDHTHADFNTIESVPKKSALIELLEDSYDVQSILTIRDPLDSYASLVKSNWVHFEPKSFDEYCRRLLLLMKQFHPEQIFKYEEFLVAPKEQMQAIAHALTLPFEDSFEDIFCIFSVTGNSGRSDDVIGMRERIVPEDIIRKSESSECYASYKKLNVVK